MFQSAVSHLLAWASFLTVAGVIQDPQSRLNPQERAQVLGIGKQIDGSMLSGGTKTEIGLVKDVILPDTDGSVAVRIYRPVKASSKGTVLLVHGGAFIAGSIQSHDNMARLICSASEANVVSVEYTRAPAAMYPTQLNEVRSVLKWLSKDGKKEELEAQPLAVCGDSAGGNMTAVLARDTKMALAVLSSAVGDMTLAAVTEAGGKFFS